MTNQRHNFASDSVAVYKDANGQWINNNDILLNIKSKRKHTGVAHFKDGEWKYECVDDEGNWRKLKLYGIDTSTTLIIGNYDNRGDRCLLNWRNFFNNDPIKISLSWGSGFVGSDYHLQINNESIQISNDNPDEARKNAIELLNKMYGQSFGIEDMPFKWNGTL